jgi:hypothetical protein
MRETKRQPGDETMTTRTDLRKEDVELTTKLETLSTYYQPGSKAYKAAERMYLGRRQIVRNQLARMNKDDDDFVNFHEAEEYRRCGIA